VVAVVVVLWPQSVEEPAPRAGDHKPGRSAAVKASSQLGAPDGACMCAPYNRCDTAAPAFPRNTK
jgi:hypothetical protein